MSVIYDFYEKGILLPQKSGNEVDNYSYVCVSWKKRGVKKDGDDIKIKREKS
jgi:hypothetical protein